MLYDKPSWGVEEKRRPQWEGEETNKAGIYRLADLGNLQKMRK